jgi:adenylate cyclase
VKKSTQTPVRDYGTLVPEGGGDPIPLLKKRLMVGRRESCDIVLRFKNISAHHCQLVVRGGYWYVKDLKSLNGVKINKAAVTDKRLDSGDILSIAKHHYRIFYVPSDLGAVGPPPPDESVDEIFGESLLRRSGLEKKQKPQRENRQRDSRAVDGDADTPLSNPPNG